MTFPSQVKEQAMKGWKEANMFGKQMITKQLLEAANECLEYVKRAQYRGEEGAELARDRLLAAIYRAEGRAE